MKSCIFTAVKVLRQCPFVLVVKVDGRQGEVLGSGEGRAEKQGLSRVPLRSVRVPKLNINLGRAEFG
jgi:hypothetical protein